MTFTRNFQRLIGAELHVMLPARVEKYDHTKQKANVTPLIRKRYLDEKIEDQPLLSNVPVVFPRSGGASLTFPVEKGDYGFLVFCDLDMDDWLVRGGMQNPQDPRQHALPDCLFIVGLMPFSDKSMSENNRDVFLIFKGNKFRLRPNGHVDLETENTVNIKTKNANVEAEQKVIIDCQQAIVNAEEKVTANTPLVEVPNGDVVASGKSLVTHTHGGVESGPSSTGPPN